MRGWTSPFLGAALIGACCFAALSSTASAAAAELSSLRCQPASGFFHTALVARLSDPDAPRIFFTTNGVEPRPDDGFRYDHPLRFHATTILRATSFDAADRPIHRLTRTFLFLEDVVRQTGQGWPSTWGAQEGWTVPAHYAMDSTRFDTNQLARSLSSLPSISLVTDPGHLFSPESGIYIHPTERGATWERPVTVEWFGADGLPAFQLNCGLRIHGGMSRDPRESPKHSFRLLFKGRYGDPKLRFPLFGDSYGGEFESLVLRAANNDSWLATDGAQRRQASYLRDEWMRRTLRVIGHPSAYGCFAHLYLNGLYWGLYNVCEWPGTATGPACDLIKADRVESGDRIAWDRLLSLVELDLSQDQTYHAVDQLLDVPQFIDYLILNFYTGNSDWDRSANWYAARPRIPNGKFVFFPWDAECILRQPLEQTLDFDADNSPPGLFQKLKQNQHFRSLFARRAEALTHGSGPLAPTPAAERMRSLVNLVAPAILAEAARWGAYRHTIHPYKSGPFAPYDLTQHWEPEMHRMLTQFFPQRSAIVLEQFRQRGLSPSTPSR